MENIKFSRSREKFLFLLSIFLSRARLLSMPGRKGKLHCSRKDLGWKCLTQYKDQKGKYISNLNRLVGPRTYIYNIYVCDTTMYQIFETYLLVQERAGRRMALQVTTCRKLQVLHLYLTKTFWMTKSRCWRAPGRTPSCSQRCQTHSPERQE